MQEQKRQEDRPPKRRWLRRLAIFLLIFIFIIGLLIFFAPAIFTSKWAENKIAEIAGERIGRTVELGDVRFGWNTELFIEELLIPSIDDEKGYPPLHAKNILVPITLWELRKGLPVDLEGTKAEYVEANLVRLRDGAWNWVVIAETAAGEEKPKEEKPPSALPVSQFTITIDELHTRVLDESQDLLAGWENGSVDALWPGGTQPISVDLAGDLRMNDERIPWDVRAKVMDWINDDRFVTTDTMELLTSSDGMQADHQIVDGGFFVHATAKPEKENIVRIVLPLERMRRFASAAPLPAQAPRVDGELDMRLEFNHANNFKLWDMQARIEGEGVSAELEGEQELEIPPQDFQLTVVTSFDMEKRILSTLDVNLGSGFATANVVVEAMPFDEPLAVDQFQMEAALDITEASLAGAQIMGGNLSEAPVEGAITFAARKQEAPNSIPTFYVSMDFSPKLLRTLQPFAADPEFLQEDPLPLTALAFQTELVGAYDLDAKEVAVTLQEWQGLSIQNWKLSAKSTTEPLAWFVDTSGKIDLAVPFNQFGERFAPPALQNIAGELAFDFFAEQPPNSNAYASSGTMRLNDLLVSMQDLSDSIMEESIYFGWDLVARPEQKAAEISNLVLQTSFAEISTTGTIADTFDIGLRATANLDRVLLFAQPWMATPLPLGGDLRLVADAQGALSESIDAELLLESDGPISYEHELATFQEPVLLAAVGSVRYIDKFPAQGSLNIKTLSAGSLLKSSMQTDFDLSEGGGVEGVLNAALDFGRLTGMLDPALWQEKRFDFAISGASELELEFGGPIERTETGFVYPDLWNAAGALVTEVPALEWYFEPAEGEAMEGLVEEFFDEREFEAAFSPDQSTSPSYNDQAMTGFGVVSGPMGIEIGTTEIASAIRLPTPSDITFTINEAAIERIAYQKDEAAFELPMTTFAGSINALMDETFVRVQEFTAAISNAGEMSTNSSFNWESKSWATDTRIEIGNLSEAVVLAQQSSAVEQEWLETLQGSLLFEANMSGAVPGEQFNYLQGLPVEGTAALNSSGLSFAMPRGMQVEGFDAEFGLDIPEGGANADFDFQARLAQFSNPSLEQKPLKNLNLSMSGVLENFDVFRMYLEELSIENYLTQMDGQFEATNLQQAMNDDELQGMAKFLRNMRMNGEARLQQELAGLTGFKDELVMDGFLDLTLFLRNNPETVFQISALTDLRDAALSWAELFTAEEINGTWDASKTLLLTTEGRKAVSPGEGVFTIGRMGFSTQMMAGEILNSRIGVRGLEEGLSIIFGSREFLKGSATSSVNLRLDQGDPVLTGRVEATGVDMAQLALRAYSGAAARQDELNAAGTLSWRFQQDTGGRFLDDLTVELKSTRIGENALARLLRGLDADQDDPRFQNALSALRLGTPISSTFLLQNSLVTFKSELRLPGGIKTPLPILERQPLGDLLEVYEFDEYGPLVDLTRWGLLLVLSPTLDEFEEVLAAPETDQ